MLENDKRMFEAIGESGFDALLASSMENVYYLSGGPTTIGQTITGTSPTFVLITKDDLSSPIFILGVRDLGPFFDAPFSENSRIQTFGNFYLAQPKRGIELTSLDESIIELLQSGKLMKGPVEAIVEMIERSGLSHAKIGVDEVGISWALFQDLERALPDALLTPASAVFREVRSVKTKEEIRRLRQAVTITGRAILESIRVAREGVTEKTLARRIKMSMLRQGAHPFFTMISFGSRGAHALWPSDAALRRGDLIKYDVGCVCEGYKSDVARVAILGKADDRVRGCFGAVRAGTDRVMELVKPGVRVGELF
jgi:Xaa-Pro dipeptidase